MEEMAKEDHISLRTGKRILRLTAKIFSMSPKAFYLFYNVQNLIAQCLFYSCAFLKTRTYILDPKGKVSLDYGKNY